MYKVYSRDDKEFQLVEEPDLSGNYTYTYADYLKWTFEGRVELIKGYIFKMSPASNLKHQQISAKIFARLFSFLEKKPCQVIAAPFDVRLPMFDKKKDREITTVVQPDISIICDANKLDERGCCGAPDLIIEILSPGNTKKEVKLKFSLYEEAGVKEYWIVYPSEENIAVFILNDKNKYDGATIYASGDNIKSSVIKGLKINVDDAFLT